MVRTGAPRRAACIALRGMAAWFAIWSWPSRCRSAHARRHRHVLALASCTPERLVRQTGRLERSLGSGRRAVVDLTVAQHWIRRARQLTN